MYSCKCKCNNFREHVGNGPAINGASMPTRNGNAFHTAREKRWERDGNALKSLAGQGFNPPVLDGLGDIASKATQPIEIEHGKIYGKDAKVIQELSDVMKAS